MYRLTISAVLAILYIFISTPLGAADLAPAAEQKVILVLDASGSMWGQVEGKTKIEIARESIAGLVREWNSGIQLGLMTYGHRRKGDCSDIEMIIPVSRVDPAAITGAVNRIKPKGKTPLSAAVRMAAERLKYQEESATVILMSDGIETCNMDPCALGKELEESGIDFTAHVIGFDLSREEQSKLSCLAENSGGLFVSAGDATSLNEAFKKVEEEVIKATPVKPQPRVEPGLKLIALQADGGIPINGVAWHVTEPEPDINGNYKVINSAWDTPVFKLPSGAYRITATWGSANSEARVDVDAKKAMVFKLILDAGQVKLSAVQAEGSPPLSEGVLFEITSATPDIHGNYTQIAADWGGSPVFALSAGTYRTRVSWGHSAAEDTFEITAGKLTEKTVSLDAGQVKLSAIPAEGAPPLSQEVLFEITSATPDIHGNYTQIAADWGGSPVFVLTAGKYTTRAGWGLASTTESIEIEAGKLLEKTITLNAGRIKLMAYPVGETRPIPQGALFQITSTEPDINGNYRQIAADWGGAPVFVLPAGTYRALVNWDNQEAEHIIEVIAGKTLETKVELK